MENLEGTFHLSMRSIPCRPSLDFSPANVFQKKTAGLVINSRRCRTKVEFQTCSCGDSKEI